MQAEHWRLTHASIARGWGPRAMACGSGRRIIMRCACAHLQSSVKQERRLSRSASYLNTVPLEKGMFTVDYPPLQDKLGALDDIDAPPTGFFTSGFSSGISDATDPYGSDVGATHSLNRAALAVAATCIGLLLALRASARRSPPEAHFEDDTMECSSDSAEVRTSMTHRCIKDRHACACMLPVSSISLVFSAWWRIQSLRLLNEPERRFNPPCPAANCSGMQSESLQPPHSCRCPWSGSSF